jgi:putative SOS response-associated peptidase YedK
MCNQYTPTRADRIAAQFDSSLIEDAWKAVLGPWDKGPFVRQVGQQRETVLGQWALIADFASEAKSSKRIMTNNARSETVATKPTFRGPWHRGQRCLVPADAFVEPNWETGCNVWWQFKRKDGKPWAVAGLWNRWTDKESGEQVESYTMLTLNADAHPLMSRMHKPDPKLPPDKQDKRSLVLLEEADWQAWLSGTLSEAAALIRLTPIEAFEAGPRESLTQGRR